MFHGNHRLPVKCTYRKSILCKYFFIYVRGVREFFDFLGIWVENGLGQREMKIFENLEFSSFKVFT